MSDTISGTNPNSIGRGTAWSGDGSLIAPEAWMRDALCAQVEPDLFFADAKDGVEAARAICERCPVTDECLAYALGNGERHGVWGGKDRRERAALRRDAA